MVTWRMMIEPEESSNCRVNKGNWESGGSIWVKISKLLFWLASTSPQNCTFHNNSEIYRLERKFNKRYGETWSPNSFIQSLSLLLLFLFLICLAMVENRRKDASVSRGKEFWTLFCLGKWGTNCSLGRKGCLGRARVWRKLCKFIMNKWASSKTVSKESANTSCALPTGCFLDTMY